MSLATTEANPFCVRILGVGNPFLDRIVHVDSLPEGLKKGGTAPVFEKSVIEQFWQKAYGTSENYNWSLGGSCANVIKVLPSLLSSLSLDYSCLLLGKVGNDRKEDFNQRLKNIGIISYLKVGTKDNGIVNCFVTPDNDRTMQTFFGASSELTKEDILLEHFEHVSHVHLEGYLAYSPDILETSIQFAQEKGAKVSIDLSSVDVINAFSEKLKICAKKIDLISGNFQEMEAFTGCKNVSEMIKSFDSKQIIVITDGENGCWVKPQNKVEALKFDALKIATHKIVDTTGAGDFFLAGFLAGLLGKKDIQTCVKIANLAAGFVIQQDGADLPEHEWNELKRQVGELATIKA